MRAAEAPLPQQDGPDGQRDDGRNVPTQPPWPIRPTGAACAEAFLAKQREVFGAGCVAALVIKATCTGTTPRAPTLLFSVIKNVFFTFILDLFYYIVYKTFRYV